MAADFDQQSYWHTRFASETSFEWLVPSATFMAILEPHLDNVARILQMGLGTSDLHNHLRCRGLQRQQQPCITNIDYEPLAIERGRQLEKQAFGDVEMAYLVADVTQLDLQLPDQEFDLIIDKSTVDAVACGGDGPLLRMIAGVKSRLSANGVWISLSYSSLRFDIEGLPTVNRIRGHYIHCVEISCVGSVVFCEAEVNE